MGTGRRGLVKLGAAGLLSRSARAQPARVAVEGSARAGGLPFRTANFDMVGVFDADWLLDARYARMLDAMAASPGAFGAVRVFGILNAGSREHDFPTASGGTWTDPSQPPDFTLALEILQALVERGLVPFLPLTFFPPAVSPGPIAPPAELGPWQRLVRGFLEAATARFGAAELSRWWFEVWNEPNMPQFWGGTWDDYLALYRATAGALQGLSPAPRLGGPALAWLPGEGPALMERFLCVLRDEPDLPCDFLSFHRKGVWLEEEGEPRMDRLVEAAETTAALALRLVPGRCARGLPIVNNEADMRVGFQRPYAPRMSERHAAWLAALATTHAALNARHGARGLHFVAAADNANQHLMEQPFDGRRTLMTPTALERPDDLVKLPVFAFYEMLRMLGDGLCQADAPREGLHLLVTADAHRIGALLTHHPDGAAPALDLDWTLRDVPWPRVNLALFRIDGRLSNAFAANGARMPSPPLGAEEARLLRGAAELAEAAPILHDIPVEGGALRLPVRLEPFATVLAWITPISKVAPAAPRWIEAAARRGDAVLRWTPNTEPDFHGYELLREGVAGPVAPIPLRAALWVDTAPPAGTALRYAVRAVSASGLRSALVPAPELVLPRG